MAMKIRSIIPSGPSKIEICPTGQRDMKEKILFIADGHHRYEAALAYKKENGKGRSFPLTGKEPFQLCDDVFLCI